MSNVLFGCDPEMFSFYTQWGQNYAISPISLEDEYGLRPEKDDVKHPIYYHNDDGCIIMDGVAFEINLFKPFKSSKDMFIAVNNLRKEFDQQLLLSCGFNVIALPSIHFDNDKWWLDKYEHDERKLMGFIFGCDRSYNAKLECEAPFIDARHHEYRYGGGHIHTSHPILADNPLQAIRTMDMLLGTYFLSKSPFKEEELERSKIYGKPGSFRPQEYKDGSKGIEYRTCSNNWLNLTTEEFSMLDILVDKVLSLLTDRNKLITTFKQFQNDADYAIETADFELSEKVYKAVLSV